jgi:hypothetical protein
MSNTAHNFRSWSIAFTWVDVLNQASAKGAVVVAQGSR